MAATRPTGLCPSDCSGPEVLAPKGAPPAATPPARAGSITLFIGPMFARKTSSMIDSVRKYSLAGRNCVVVKYSGDARYGSGAALATHAELRQESTRQTTEQGAICVVSVSRLAEASARLAPDDQVVGVDEGQFYPDLVEECQAWASSGRRVFVAALDGTYKRQPFGRVLELIPLAEHVTKLSAVCMACRDENAVAAFTIRTTSEADEIVIGSGEKYKAVCRGCYEAAGAGRREQPH